MGSENLRRNFDELKDLAEEQETRLRYHGARAQNMVMACLIWQRFFAFGMSQASSSSSSLSINCSNWWMVLGLSLSGTFLYFLFVLEALAMWYRAHYHLDIICTKQTELCQHILDARNPDDADTSGDSSDGFEIMKLHLQVLEYHPFTIVNRKFYIGSIVCALLLVTAFELYACKYSLCTN